MDCNEAERSLNEFVDGEFPAWNEGAFFAHLAGCESCAAFLRFLMNARSHFVSAGSSPEPEADASRERKRSRVEVLSTRARWLAAAVIVFVAIGTGALFFSIGKNEGTKTSAEARKEQIIYVIMTSDPSRGTQTVFQGYGVLPYVVTPGGVLQQTPNKSIEY